MNQCSLEIPKMCGLLNNCPINPKVVAPLIDRDMNHVVDAEHDEEETFLVQSLAPYVAAVLITITTMMFVLIGSIGLFMVIIQGQRIRMSTLIIWIKLSLVLLSWTLLACGGGNPGAHGLSLPCLRIKNEHIASAFQIKALCSQTLDCGVRSDIPVIWYPLFYSSYIVPFTTLPHPASALSLS